MVAVQIAVAQVVGGSLVLLIVRVEPGEEGVRHSVESLVSGTVSKVRGTSDRTVLLKTLAVRRQDLLRSLEIITGSFLTSVVLAIGSLLLRFKSHHFVCDLRWLFIQMLRLRLLRTSLTSVVRQSVRLVLLLLQVSIIKRVLSFLLLFIL